jgi:hypothetical protein
LAISWHGGKESRRTHDAFPILNLPGYVLLIAPPFRKGAALPELNAATMAAVCAHQRPELEE